MKTKSKLVLGLSILSAATLAAGATSTFAWYTATNAGSVDSKINTQLATVKESYSIGSEITGLSVEADNASHQLVLSHWADGDANVTTYYLDSAGTPHQYTGSLGTNHVLVKAYTVYLPQISDVDQISGLMGKTLTIKAQALTKDTANKTPDQTGYVTTESAAIIQLVASDGTVDGKVENSTAASGTGVTFTVPNTYAGAKTAIAKIGIRVDGGAITGTQSESADSLNGDFYVTVAS